MSENVRSHHKPTLLDETRSPLVRFCHRAIFSIILGVLVLSPLIAGHSRPWALGFLMIGVLLAGGFWMLRVLVVQEVQIVFSRLGAPCVVLAAYALVRYSLSPVEPVARPDMLLVITGVLWFFLVLNDIRHRWHLTVLVWTLTGLGVLVTLMAAWQLIHHDRVTGPFARPADLAGYLLLIIPLVAGNFFFSRRALGERIGFAFAGLLMCAGLVMTQSYWHWLGWLAAFLVVAFFAVQKRNWRFRWLIIGVAVLASALIVALVSVYAMRRATLPSSEREEIVSTRDDGEFVGADVMGQLRHDKLDTLSEQTRAISPGAKQRREPLWQAALALGQRNPWIGAGPGMFEWLYPSVRSFQGRFHRSANECCNVFAEAGIVGCALVLWLAASLVITIVQILNIRADRYSAGQQSNRFAFTVGGLAVIAAVAVNAVVDFNLRVPGNLFTLLAITSAVLTCGVHRRANEEEPVPRPGRHVTLRMGGLSRLVLVAGLAMVLALLLTRLGHSFPSTLFRARGDRAAAQLSWSDAESAYLRAWRFDRRNFETAIALGDLFSVRATWNIRQRETLAAQALSWYRRARTLNPYAYDVLIRIARLQDALGQRDPARATYREALQNDPKNASYHAQFGWHYQRWGEPDLAQRSFRLARRFGATEILPASEPQKTDTAGS